ncbi:hypothetical protein M569_07275 [Genlisea aurea]|uniref:NAD(P)-binding domain-containing protein n=1 Tax=Genlisea aurea TaxID=192259 RepID=S8CL84_9LAMI|nr:hypothetical protein M569_07275 [Genlisea aurea]
MATYWELGYEPVTDLETGLRKFVEWYLDYYGAKKKKKINTSSSSRSSSSFW